MKVDRQQFLTDGYLIIRECIPPQQLEQLRQSFETLVEHQRGIWKRERKPDDPPGGLWETASQPRLWFDTIVGFDSLSRRVHLEKPFRRAST